MSSFDAFYNRGFLNLQQNIIFPEPLVAGDSWCFQYWSGDWGSSGYTAEITFAAATAKLSSPAVLDDGWYKWNVPGSSTSSLPASPYSYNVHVTDPSGSQRITIERGAVKVACDIKVPGTNVVSQTKLQMMLEALDNTLIQLMSNKTSMVQFSGQMYQMQDIDRLWTVREKLATQVADEQEELRGNKRARRIVTYFRQM